MPNQVGPYRARPRRNGVLHPTGHLSPNQPDGRHETRRKIFLAIAVVGLCVIAAILLVSIARQSSNGDLDTPGSNAFVSCGDGLWQHVYHPQRLIVLRSCITVTGTLVDATAGSAHPSRDGVRHESDGDTHGWLRVDSTFADLINDGNRRHEDGNLIFEIVCRYSVKQADARPACEAFRDTIAIPPPGSHVAITGTLVLDDAHDRWAEIHPVSRIEIIP